MSIEIEVITTKKKLNKSIVKQLKPASIGDMLQAVNVNREGYHIRDLGSGYPSQVAVFKGINEWCILGLRDWRSSGDLDISAKPLKGRGISYRKFKTTEERDAWIEAYNNAKELCLKVHLIL
ncbi:hypothetical protein DN730_07920 [Marinomonas piezotolerans]|uniref:Uncharacterized protein n=1 Tax=Marinomonas piezotolerans TaxID=2213058 RepID=A0A370U9A5_9GAMM|nr:hypothetical protein [Marinomonas piezotolerans]RDL44323.1 hypothetical protein DN730_07920 [Marinomonas piezotolerans]